MSEIPAIDTAKLDVATIAKATSTPAPNTSIAAEQAEQVRRTTAATILADGKHVTSDGLTAAQIIELGDEHYADVNDLNDPDDYD